MLAAVEEAVAVRESEPEVALDRRTKATNQGIRTKALWLSESLPELKVGNSQ
jgi:hypothetical protein